MKKLYPIAVIVIALAGAVAAVKSKTFHKKGLQQGGPAMNTPNLAAPGTTKPLPRAYDGAPPGIPHGIVGLNVTRAANDCMDCHLEGVEVAEGHRATKIPVSHFTNIHTKETRTDRPIGIRYNCLQCHAPKDASAQPPVPQTP